MSCVFNVGAVETLVTADDVCAENQIAVGTAAESSLAFVAVRSLSRCLVVHHAWLLVVLAEIVASPALDSDSCLRKTTATTGFDVDRSD